MDASADFFHEDDIHEISQIRRLDFVDFIILNACHSENIGRAYHQAGVKHVICVKADKELADEAAVIFSRAFYGELFN
jgi:hypothetical protein